MHLAITLLLIILTGGSFFLLLVPRIRQVQSDRLLVLKLLLLVPKSVVWDFVYRIYRDDSEDELNDDDLDDGKSRADGNEEANKLKAKALRLHSEESVEIVQDNIYGLYLFFGLLMFSLVIPSIVHVAWKYSFNTLWIEHLDMYKNTVLLYSTLNSLGWRAVGLWGVCDFRRPRDYAFCASVKATTANIRETTDITYGYYYKIQNKFAGDDQVDELLYSIPQQTELFESCESSIEIPIELGKGYHYPPGTDLNQAKVIVPASYYRCNDTFESDEHTPPKLRLPSDYSIETTHGVGLYIRNVLRASWVLGQTPGFAGGIPTGPIDEESYWFLYESLSSEGGEGVAHLKNVAKHKLLEEYKASQTAYNATYAITLVYLVILFLGVFANLRKDLINESRHNRGSKFFNDGLIFSSFHGSSFDCCQE
jgi:hypothetical protein